MEFVAVVRFELASSDSKSEILNLCTIPLYFAGPEGFEPSSNGLEPFMLTHYTKDLYMK